MMGFGEESLACFDKILPFKLSVTDQSSVHFHKAETHLMLGQIQSAADSYRKSIKLTPCKTDRYYSLVAACRELKGMKKDKWHALMNEIREVMQNCLSGEELNIDFDVYDKLDSPGAKGKSQLRSLATADSFTDSYEDDDEEEEDYTLQSYLEFGSEGGDNVENSAVYWALYIVAEKTERYSLAWWYLERANQIEKAARANKYHQEETLTQRAQITEIFTSEFWQALPDLSGDSSTVPIFIIGMMR